MPGLILHNVPDDELFVGDDGVQRPYAMLFPQQDGTSGPSRARRGMAETGSFGKSTRRSRSRTGTPAKRENPTQVVADKLFTNWLANNASTPNSTTTTPQRIPGGLGGLTASVSQPSLLGSGIDDPTPAVQNRPLNSEPTEVILRGYRSIDQQYAAINHYEQLAGRICEDYTREPPQDQRRYKSELRDPAFTRRQPLTPDERSKVNRAANGEHWVKVTFESAEAADSAIFASPQNILGYLVHAEPFLGVPPARDEANPDVESVLEDHARSRSVPAAPLTPSRDRHSRRAASAFPTSFTAPSLRSLSDLSPPHSQSSSQTMDTGLSATLSSATVTGEPVSVPATPALADSVFCRRIPTARKAKLLPAEQALLPQQSYMQRVMSAIPILGWFGGSMIGNEVPRTDLGDFDWNRASLYWKVIWWLDFYFRLFGGDMLNADKDD